jgi:hypothetical protein
MTRKMNAAWLAALGASMMLMVAQAHGMIQKPLTPRFAAAPKVSTATLTGCLRMEGKQFELTNLKGSDVRTGRSWKSGFIKKTSRNVEVVGVSPSVKLQDHVGREVSVVGTRSDETHLQASSIRRVATSCSHS